MSHLREQISALIDGELTGAELDRANAHLAACVRCRDEAAALRQLKRELRSLASVPAEEAADTGPAVDTDPAADVPGGGAAGWADEELTRRLLAMAGPGGPVPSRSFRREQARRKRREQRGRRPGSGPGGPSAPGGRTREWAARYPHADADPYAVRALRAPRHRGRYMVWSAVSLVVVGVGTAAFTMGGGSPQPGPKVPLQQELQMFGLEHAITSGDVLFPGPTATARP